VTKVFDYTIPMSIDGVPVEASGTLTWVGSDSSVPVLPFVGLGLLVAVALAGAVVIRRRRQDGAADPDQPAAGSSTEAW
jgi:MYXO-CTERM domain-containing protein